MLFRKLGKVSPAPLILSLAASKPSRFFLLGGFDPGSGLTLAACLRHASRTDDLRVAIRGES